VTKTTKYTYTGPTTGITFRGPNGTKTEVMLFNGKQVDLPDCPPVSTLIALKRLAPVAAEAAAAPAASTAAVGADATSTTTTTAQEKGA
jgi:hypothetical protein